MQVGRYSTVAAVPRPEQIDPLQARVTVDFPQRTVRTVGDALRLLLRPSGYRLAAIEAADPALPTLLAWPLPEVQRHLGPCTLQAALTTLASPVYRLVIDAPHRRVSFELTDHYRAMIQAPQPALAKEPSGHVTLPR